jgi:hypothetical protein
MGATKYPLMKQETKASSAHVALLILLSWLSMLGVDLPLHGGLLAKFYLQPGPFLLPPARAFQLIPLGYLSFLLLAVLLVWLMLTLKIQGWRSGLLFGLKVGALIWGALVLGLMSISTADLWLLLGWFLGQTCELAIAGMFAGSALGGTRLRRLFIMVVLLIFLSVLVTVVLQSIGLVPTIRV